VDPILIVIGLVLGILPVKPRIWLPVVGALSLLWAIIGHYDSAGGVGDFILAFIVAAANLGIGLAIGTAISLLFEGRRTGPSRRV
jgi:hypothetical protein